MISKKLLHTALNRAQVVMGRMDLAIAELEKGKKELLALTMRLAEQVKKDTGSGDRSTNGRSD